MKRLVAIFLLALPGVAHAQNQDPSSTPAQTANQAVFTVTVIESTPLPGMDLPVEKIPAPVQIATSEDIDKAAALDLSSFLTRRFNGVYENAIQNNPFQTDISYRGYTASPLLGTPQGLSVYMDGVRMNQPFGDVVSWDLIPRMAIGSTTMMPGSNPLFGLNTLGGALAIQTKNGNDNRGATVQAIYGSDERRSVEFEYGGRGGPGLNWYVAGNAFNEDGWREDSPSEVRQLFGKLGWQRPDRELFVSLGYADNSLTGNGPQEVGFLEDDYSSIYTKPDITDNRSTLLNATFRRDLSNSVTLSGNGYYRDIATGTLNGDINEDSLDQAIYQPTPAEQAALTAAGYTGFPTSGATAENTPFPYWRCLGNVLLNDEPAEKCNGLLNRSTTDQHNGGLWGQVSARRSLTRGTNQFTAGGGYDRSRAAFVQSTELGYLNPDRSITGTDAFADGKTGGEVDGEPYDTRVDLDGLTQTWSLYATNTITLGHWNFTASGRYNRTSIENRDMIQPGSGHGSLDGDHTFSRLNPAAGATYSPSPTLNIYFGYGEGSRAATSIELGCADPEEPCKLPNAMTGDPPLSQVVTKTWEAGARGDRNGINWSAGVFHAVNADDILFVMSEQTGFGYFRNFGETRRQGFELSAGGKWGRVTLGSGYTFLAATYQSEESVNGESNSSNDAAEGGTPGLEGRIEIEPGDQVPLIPRHMLKAYANVQATSALSLDVDLVAISSSYARGNENNLHEGDGTYYLGDGNVPGYAVVNLGATYRVRPWLGIVAQISNLFDTRYYTSSQLGAMGFMSSGAFIARPFPPVNGQFPLRHSTFIAPGAPIRAWFGTRFTF